MRDFVQQEDSFYDLCCCAGCCSSADSAGDASDASFFSDFKYFRTSSRAFLAGLRHQSFGEAVLS